MSEPRLWSATLRFRPEAPAPLPTAHGPLLQAAWLAAVRSVDADLAVAWHGGTAPRPYTLSLLAPAPDGEQHCRVTVLDAVAWGRLLPALWRPGPWRIGPAWCHLLAAHVESASWVDLAAPTTDCRALRLEFVSPTAFSLGSAGDGRREIGLFPTPALLFGNLARRWTTYSPLALLLTARAIEEQAPAGVRVGPFRLETQTQRFPRHVQLGVVGRIAYEIRCGSPVAESLHTLLRFAPWAGVGIQTSRGMGQVRLVEGQAND